MKKKKKMLKAQKKKIEKFSFKFSDADTLITEDKTTKSLEQLASLDICGRSFVNVSIETGQCQGETVTLLVR